MLHNLDILLKGEKYTMVVFGFNGYPRAIKMYFHRFVYESNVMVVFKYHPYNRVCGGGQVTLTAKRQFILWAGHHDPQVDMTVAIFHKDDGCGLVQMRKTYTPFNTRYMQRALVSIKQLPLLKNINLINVNDRLVDICTATG